MEMDRTQHQWLPPVAALEAIAGLALTEPDVGSDLRAVSTTMVVDGDELVVNGRKSFITNGGAADFYCTLAREGEGWSMVLIPAVHYGLPVTPGSALIAPHILGELTFTDARVPVGNRLGVPGKAFSLMLQTLAVFRVTVAASAVGLAQAALDEAVAAIGERIDGSVRRLAPHVPRGLSHPRAGCHRVPARRCRDRDRPGPASW
jgi:acyl-CoA dehydrogenase